MSPPAANSSSGEGKWKRRYYALSESPDGSGAVFAVYKDAAKSTVKLFFPLLKHLKRA